MAVISDLRLVSLAVLMLVSQLDFSSATVVVYGLRGRDLPGDALGNKPDPYVKIWCGSSYQVTSYYQGNSNPSWSSKYTFSGCNSGHTLKLEVWDKDARYDDRLGYFSTTVRKGTSNQGSFSLQKKGTMYFSYDVK